MSTQRWIHCNLCSALLANQETKFYHLSCLDVLCRSCMGKTDRGTCCPVCKNAIHHFTELGSTMSRKERMLYHSFPAGLYQMSCQTLMFQQRQRQRLVQSILKARESLVRLDELEVEIKKQITLTQRRYQNMRNYRRSLQENMRNTVIRPGGGEGGDSVALVPFCSKTSGRMPQRRMSTCCTPVKPAQPVRRSSVDGFSLVNSVKMSQQASASTKPFSLMSSVKMSQASSTNDSGIGMNTPSDAGGVAGSIFSASGTASSMISPVEMDRTHPKRRMSVAGCMIPVNSTPFKPPRRSSIDSFKQLLGGGGSGCDNRWNSAGRTPASGLLRGGAATAITDFYSKNK